MIGRPREGIGFVQRATVYTGIRLANGKRHTWPVAETDPPPAGVALAVPWAKAVSLARQARYDRGEWQPSDCVSVPGIAETVAAWAKRWCDAREASGLVSVDDDRGRLRGHILPVIGNDPIATVPSARIEDVRDALDAKLRAGEIMSATVTKAWGVVTKMFADAQRAKDRSLRVRADNPVLDIAAPDREAERVGPILYPDEAFALLTCKRVPQRWRELFALAIYTYGRASEIAAYAVDAVDLDRGTLHIHCTMDADGTIDRTKPGVTRRIPIEPAAREFIATLVRGAGPSGRLVEKMPMREDLAAYLRKCLGYAGVTRAELFATDTTRRPLSFHDLRATGITWMALRGDNALAIQQRAGHTTFSTTQGYVRLAETLGNVGAVFPPVPTFVTGFVTRPAEGREALTFPAENWRPQRDLKAFHAASSRGSARNCVDATTRCGESDSPNGTSVTGFVTRLTGEIAAQHWYDQALAQEFER